MEECCSLSQRTGEDNSWKEKRNAFIRKIYNLQVNILALIKYKCFKCKANGYKMAGKEN